MLHFVFDSDADTDADTDACGKGSRPDSPSFLSGSPQHLAAGVLIGIGIGIGIGIESEFESESEFEFESESESVPMLFENPAKSLFVDSFLIPEGFEQIARGREAHPGFKWETENNPGGVEASAGSAPTEGFEG
jgi:hypothetical protein